ncbi:glycosyltransferase family 4 protein [Sphingomonas fennica]|uniref:Transcription elongation factor GreAB n=1 Tax=Edaphosphingomonas fennica TaxID=114404 RepID=A0A2T4HLV2_9SPHN|nr:glycosyltransferase family 1 protein [Sphingomonas fennica]PTD16757.1 transcription elongation factor GreAB [Sphingomonas fennica]
MRVILGVEALAPDLSGIGRYTWELCKGLKSCPEIDELHYYRARQWISDPARLLEADAPSSPRRRGRLMRWWHGRQHGRRLRDSLFHGPNFFLPPEVEGGIVTVHDLSVFRFPETHPAARIAQFEREFASSMARVAHVITDSETVRAELMAFAGLPEDRVTAVPLGVADAFHPRTSGDLAPLLARFGLMPDAYALCVSTLEPRKKIGRLLEAWGALPVGLRSRWPLILAGGSGWLNGALRDVIAIGEREGWVRYLGYVPEDMLPALYAGARLFIYPSTYEGFGLPPVEAMASGVPALVASASCLPEVTQGAAMLVEPDDIAGFMVAIEQGLIDEAWRKGAIIRGLAVARTYDWAHCVAGTVAVYRRLAGRAAIQDRGIEIHGRSSGARMAS